MPTNIVLSKEERAAMQDGGGLKKRTIEDRSKDIQSFSRFFDSRTGGKKLEDLAKDEEGRNQITEVVSEYFYSMRVNSLEGGVKRPKKLYAEKMKSSIKMTLIADIRVNIFDPVLFPKADKMWKGFIEKLAEEGRADVKHKEEISANALDKIYDLLWNTKEALEARGTESYAEKLSKIPPAYHNKLHRLLQIGAQLVLTLYEVRRGCENLDELKAKDLVVVEDDSFEFKYIKKVASEAEKNHPRTGTNVACAGVIPYVTVGGKFNPGVFMKFYLDLVPLESTMEGVIGGWLFPRPRAQSAKLDLHKAGEMDLFEKNMKVGAKLISTMLPSLCEAANVEKYTNHSVRATAIKFMRRAGIPWLTIAKVTGHKSVESLIKHYDLSLEAPGLAEIASALAQGPAVARGQDLQPTKLKARNSNGTAATIEFGETSAPIVIEENSEPEENSRNGPATELEGDANFILALPDVTTALQKNSNISQSGYPSQNSNASAIRSPPPLVKSPQSTTTTFTSLVPRSDLPPPNPVPPRSHTDALSLPGNHLLPPSPHPISNPNAFAPQQNSYAPPRQNPYGPPQQNPYGPPQQNPYGPPQQNPYGPHQNPYAPQQENPYSPAQQNPYGPPPQNPYNPPPQNPYGLPLQNPYGPPQQNPYGPPHQNPYGPPHQISYGPPQQNPYGPPQQNPYGPPQQNPYGPRQQNPYGLPQQNFYSAYQAFQSSPHQTINYQSLQYSNAPPAAPFQPPFSNPLQNTFQLQQQNGNPLREIQNQLGHLSSNQNMPQIRKPTSFRQEKFMRVTMPKSVTDCENVVIVD